MNNLRIYPIRGDDPRLTGAQGLAFNPLDYANKSDAVNLFLKTSGAGSVAYNAAGASVIGKGSFEFTGTGTWVLNTLFPMSVDSGVKGTVHFKIASGSATMSIGYESFDANGTAMAIVANQNNFLLNAFVVSNTSYTQSTNAARSEGVSQGTIPVGTRYVRPRIDITASSGVVSIDAFILSHFLDDVLPAGVVHAYAGSTVSPATAPGYMLCDGAAVSRTIYAKLFQAIGTSYGSGDGSTTFHLPDLRGRFVRGRDGGIARDPDRAARTASNAGGATGDNVGSLQADAVQEHTHVYTGTPNSAQNFPGSGMGAQSTGVTSGVSGANVSSETRPKNVYFNYIIKY